MNDAILALALWSELVDQPGNGSRGAKCLWSGRKNYWNHLCSSVISHSAPTELEVPKGTSFIDIQRLTALRDAAVGPSLLLARLQR
jgi:hypothetical protein